MPDRLAAAIAFGRSTRLGRLAMQFAAFGMVGVCGLATDTAALYAFLYGAGFDALGSWGFLAARIPSFLVGVTTTWALNRVFTFRGARKEPLFRQWLKFTAANSAGGVVNYLTYAGCVTFGEPFTSHPVLGVAAGSVAGMLLNFSASKALVFRST